MLVLTRKLNESIVIGDNIRITIVDVKGDRIRLGIEAPRDVAVNRAELHEAKMRYVEIPLVPGDAGESIDFNIVSTGAHDETIRH